MSSDVGFTVVVTPVDCQCRHSQSGLNRGTSFGRGLAHGTGVKFQSAPAFYPGHTEAPRLRNSEALPQGDHDIGVHVPVRGHGHVTVSVHFWDEYDTRRQCGERGPAFPRDW